jgi:hypothetical protein
MAATPQTPQHTTSVDKIELNRWRFGETNGFVVKDYTGIEKGGEPVCMVLKAADIFEFIADAGERKAKVAVYAIGPCVLDWS